MIRNESGATSNCPYPESEEEPDSDEIDCICRTGSSTIADYDFAKYICPYDPYAQDLTQAMQPPSAAHLMGTDTYGRDMLSRVLIGAQTSISSTFALVAIITVFGTVVGIFCGYYGGIVDSVMMRISDVCLAFPGLVFAMAVAAILDGGVRNAVIALALISWPKYSRIARGQTLSIKNLPYMQASQLAGDSVLQMISDMYFRISQDRSWLLLCWILVP